MVRYQRAKISEKKRPTVFLRGDNRISQIDASLINEKGDLGFATVIRKESALTPIHSVKDLADNLKKFNKSLNDTTIVYCKGTEEGDLRSDSTRAAVRLMRQESLHPILVVSESELAEKLRMEPGKFYVYYKPSFINGFEAYMEKDINFDYLQAFEGVCRDEFSLNAPYL
jgi:hypothetical protein